MSWSPGDPWPGTPGGASGPPPSYPWGSSMRLYVRAGLAAGTSWKMGADPNDRLDSGNVIGPVGPTATPPTIGGRLWVDLTCDAMSVEIYDGSTRQVGIFSRDEAATLALTLYDPDRDYDPLNTASPYWFRGRTRLVAGTPIEVFAEVVTPSSGAITKFQLFTGTADRWAHAVALNPIERRSTVTASGAVKAMVSTNYPELASAVGAGDTTAQRVARIASYFGWAQPIVQVGTPSAVTLQATTLAQSFWEHLNRTLDDELGYVHVLANGSIRWLSRSVWTAGGAPVFVLGCKPGVTAFDIVTDVQMGAVDESLRNAVYAARTGGTMQVAKSTTSIAAHGNYETAERRTDLGLNDDVQVAEWANTVLMLYAYPTPAPALLSLLPARTGEPDGTTWRALLGINYASDIVRLCWSPSDGTAPLDVTVRVVGVKHTITPTGWTLEWQTVPSALAAGNVWHMGPHTYDRLDSANVLGYTHALALTQEGQRDAA